MAYQEKKLYNSIPYIDNWDKFEEKDMDSYLAKMMIFDEADIE